MSGLPSSLPLRLAQPRLNFTADAARYGINPEHPVHRRAVCVSDLTVPHGVGHNSVCICQCGWCIAERAETVEPVQGDLFAEAA